MFRAIQRRIAEWRFNRALAASRKAETDALRRGDSRTVGKVRKARRDAVRAALARSAR